MVFIIDEIVDGRAKRLPQQRVFSAGQPEAHVSSRKLGDSTGLAPPLQPSEASGKNLLVKSSCQLPPQKSDQLRPGDPATQRACYGGGGDVLVQPSAPGGRV